MIDILLGLLAILAGTLLCFFGAFVLRLVFPIWGAFAGFAFGAGLVAGFAEERFLGSVLGWALGIVFALIFAIFAYLYYAVAVVLVMASIGFLLGSGLVVALGIEWTWVAAAVGLVVGALLGVAAVVADVPMLVLILLSAAAGAGAVVAGFMLLTGALESATFTDGSITRAIQDDWWWYAAFLALAVAGAFFQALKVAAMRSSMRQAWVDPGR
jgi:hypothetical protein